MHATLGVWFLTGCTLFAGTSFYLHRTLSNDQGMSRVGLVTAASLPGLVLLLEFTIRTWIPDSLGHPRVEVYDLASLLLAILWTLVGPPLLIAATLARPRNPKPRGTAVLLLGHTAFWALSSYFALMFAAAV